MKEVKRLSQKNLHRHRGQCGEELRDGAGEVEEGKGDKRWWTEPGLGVVNTQYSAQVMWDRIAHLAPI